MTAVRVYVLRVDTVDLEHGWTEMSTADGTCRVTWTLSKLDAVPNVGDTYTVTRLRHPRTGHSTVLTPLPHSATAKGAPRRPGPIRPSETA